MVSGISGSGGMSGMFRPDPQDLFGKIDTDGSGGVSQAELQAFSEDMQEKTGNTLDASETTFTGYDSDGNGILSTEELDTLLQSGNGGAGAQSQGMGPPLPPPDQAASAYNSNLDHDTLSSLISGLQGILDKLTSGNETTGSKSAAASGGTVSNLPDPQDFFDNVDSDGSGGISQSELESMAEKMANMGGSVIDTSDEAFTSYDSDGSGSLSADELKVVMDSSASGRTAGTEGQGPPPPPPSSQQDTASSGTDSSDGSTDEQIALLKNLLDYLNKAKDSSGGTESILSVTT